MKSISTVIALLCVMIASTTALADQDRTVSFTPCSSWQYDFQSGKYLCGYTGMSVRLYDQYEVDSMVRRLEQNIDQLESRVKTLEMKP